MIWFFDNDKAIKANFGRVDAGSDAYLYLPGPSLADVDFDVRIPGTTAFAMNTAYPKVKPDYWLGMDLPGCYDSSLLYEAFPKFWRGTYSRKTYKGTDLKNLPQSYFVSIAKPEGGIGDMFKKDIPKAWFNHSLGVMLHLIVEMGFKKIHFVGCNLGGKSDYYDDRVLPEDQHQSNRRLYDQQNVFLREFKDVGQRFGVECISCTEDSPINDYMAYMPLKQALSESTAKVCGSVPKHANDVSCDEIREQAAGISWGENIRDKGVLLFADKNSEWMLDWWFYNYHKYNTYPVQVVDTGMTQQGADFCRARATYTKLPDIGITGWFLKPFALKMTTFKKTVYMDLDVEVRGSLYDLFDYNGFCVSYDKVNNFSTVPNPVNTGVLIYDSPCDLVDRWCEQTITSFRKFRSDQDVLDSIDKKFTPIPHDIHWLRIMGQNDNALLYHFTGPIGKKIIRDKIAKNT
jgi:hypothetical protein